MSARLVRHFDAELDKLFDYRTHWLRSLIRKKQPGAAPKFNKKRVEKTISSLQWDAVEALLSSNLLMPVSDFYDHKKQWHPKRGKGHGREAKARSFRRWYDANVGYKNCVYVFWKGRRCLYVGRTLGGKGRPSSQFSKHWFSQATRLDILAARGRRRVPALECRLTHEHDPAYSKNKPAHGKYFLRCEICEVERNIRLEVKDIFSLR